MGGVRGGREGKRRKGQKDTKHNTHVYAYIHMCTYERMYIYIYMRCTHLLRYLA